MNILLYMALIYDEWAWPPPIVDNMWRPSWRIRRSSQARDISIYIHVAIGDQPSQRPSPSLNLQSRLSLWESLPLSLCPSKFYFVATDGSWEWIQKGVVDNGGGQNFARLYKGPWKREVESHCEDVRFVVFFPQWAKRPTLEAVGRLFVSYLASWVKRWATSEHPPK